MRACADDVKRVSLELGGNAPFVVLGDADIDAAVAGAMIAKFRNTGQSCVAANRFIVERAIARPFVEALCAAVSKLRVGRGSDPDVDLGPVIDDAAVAKLARLVGDAIDRGARVVVGTPPLASSSQAGDRSPHVPAGLAAKGTRVVAPIVLENVTPEMAMWREEIFGPVVAIRIAADETEALALANDTDAGLVAYVFARDAARQARAVAALDAGMIGVNEGLVSTAQAPFGGVKHSGFGREGSRHGLDDYTILKYVAARTA
jgi:succinate-semialdehyde dehydrogenase/glutarate-semialdehyde dehydrogenase